MKAGKLEYADRLVRELAREACRRPIPDEGFEPIPCGEVMVCGGMCLTCSAKRYIERYPKPKVRERRIS